MNRNRPWHEIDVDAIARRRLLFTQFGPGPEDDCPRCGGDREIQRGWPCPDCQEDDR